MIRGAREPRFDCIYICIWWKWESSVLNCWSSYGQQAVIKGNLFQVSRSNVPMLLGVPWKSNTVKKYSKILLIQSAWEHKTFSLNYLISVKIFNAYLYVMLQADFLI